MLNKVMGRYEAELLTQSKALGLLTGLYGKSQRALLALLE
jgi:hypothetical protein